MRTRWATRRQQTWPERDLELPPRARLQPYSRFLRPVPGREALARDLAALRVTAGRTVLVHSAMAAVAPPRSPWGGRPDTAPVAAAVLGALRDVLGPDGTVVVPAFTASNSNTSRTYRERTAGMNPDELADYRSSMPPFDPALSPSEGIGRFAELVRLAPGALRSGHPQTSFAALGAKAARLVERHDEDCHLGDASPLGRLYDEDALIVMIGTGYDACTAFHLAEYRIPDPPRREYSCVVRRSGGAEWFTYRDVVLDDDDFAELGAAFERADAGSTEPGVRHGRVGRAGARAVRLRDAVDFAVRWLAENRLGARAAI
jgi:aminoglycoside 3-N-acetyltransferase